MELVFNFELICFLFHYAYTYLLSRSLYTHSFLFYCSVVCCCMVFLVQDIFVGFQFIYMLAWWLCLYSACVVIHCFVRLCCGQSFVFAGESVRIHNLLVMMDSVGVDVMRRLLRYPCPSSRFD